MNSTVGESPGYGRVENAKRRTAEDIEHENQVNRLDVPAYGRLVSRIDHRQAKQEAPRTERLVDMTRKPH